MVRRAVCIVLIGGSLSSWVITRGDQYVLALVGLAAVPLPVVNVLTQRGYLVAFLLWMLSAMVGLVLLLAVAGGLLLTWCLIAFGPLARQSPQVTKVAALATGAAASLLLVGLAAADLWGLTRTDPARGVRAVLYIWPSVSLAAAFVLWPPIEARRLVAQLPRGRARP